MAASGTTALSGLQRSLFSRAMPTSSETSTIERSGVVYTKEWVVDLVLDLAGYRADVDLAKMSALEPSAGEGAFLVRMAERLIDSCAHYLHPYEDCGHAITAFELDPDTANRARMAVSQLLLRKGIKPSLAESLACQWVRTGDYLLESADMNADFVLGNPPYVRLEEMVEGASDLYRSIYSTMRGRADLYVGFFEAALHQLRPEGTCAFICADRWMRNQYGSDLRRLITSNFSVDVIVEMHHANAFEDDVDAYPAITIIRNHRQNETIVASLGDQALEKNPKVVAEVLLQREVSVPRSMVNSFQTAVVNSWFVGSEPWPCKSPAQLKMLRYLESKFPPLEASAKVGIGVASGSDKIFVTKDETLVEDSRLMRLALAKDIKTGVVEWSGHFLVDPWDESGLVDLDRFPKLRAYFERHSLALKERHVGSKNVAGWYRTIDRVTHKIKSVPKLYIADIKERLLPVLDCGTTYPHHNLYYVQSEIWDLEVLGALLMSSIGQFFIDSYAVRMRGGYLRFQAQYLRRVCVPDPRSISVNTANELRDAFRSRDIDAATKLSLDVYGITPKEMELALGH
jgi:adenine-specific DNA-methyltransferase